jgi:hypothetical protein
MSRDAAAGMAHLARCGLIHCDLAARNWCASKACDDIFVGLSQWCDCEPVSLRICLHADLLAINNEDTLIHIHTYAHMQSTVSPLQHA